MASILATRTLTGRVFTSPVRHNPLIGGPRLWTSSLLLGYRFHGTKAYAIGPSEPPLLEQTIPEHFDSIVHEYGDRPAVISHHQKTTLTYRDLQVQSNALARGLESIGVKKGDRVAVSLGNNIEFAVITYSLFRLGAILVPLNPAFTIKQIESALNHLKATHLVIGSETKLPFKDSTSNLPVLQALLSPRSDSKVKSEIVPSLTHIILADSSSNLGQGFSSLPLTPFAALASHPGFSLKNISLHPHEVTNIQFTSGTTSTPKAAMLTHRSLLNNGYSIGEGLGLTPQSVVCCPPPLFHCFGSVLGYMATATHGAAIVFPSPSFDPAATLDAVTTHACTDLYGVPTMFNAELALLASAASPVRAGDAGLARMSGGIAAGSSVPAELMRRLHATMGLRNLAICYGMTETSPVSCMTTARDPLEKRVASVGRPMAHVRAKVVHPETRETLRRGERGELAVSGYLVMKGYWGDEKKTQEAMVRMPAEDEDGQKERVWMMTGDEASMDEEGYVSITGRIKDLIIRGGENVHPLEIEDCVLGLNGVNDISVVGVKDEKYGEVVGAFVIRSDDEAGEALTAQDVRDWVAGKLSRHLIPKFVFFTDGFPKTASGKVQKFSLRDTAEKLVADGQGL